MRRFSVSRGGRHGEIRIESGLLLRAGRLCREALPDARAALLVTDSNVAPLYAQSVFDSLAAVGCRVRAVVLDAGEQTKTPENAIRLCAELADFGLTQNDAVVSLGGGVAADRSARRHAGGDDRERFPVRGSGTVTVLGRDHAQRRRRHPLRAV